MPKTWLNDTIIDNFFTIIAETNDQCLFYNRSFLPKPIQFGYDDVQDWSENMGGIFERLAYPFIPINMEDIHWALSVVVMIEQEVKAYDSMGNRVMRSCRPFWGTCKRNTLPRRDVNSHENGAIRRY